MKLRVGVFLGGLSSEREVSLNSGRNVYDNLDRELYEPVPIFVDGRGALWLLPWQLISQNTTADIDERLGKEAKRLAYEDVPALIDFAFLTLHGKYGEDGCFQGLLEVLGVPYSGSGVLASALGMDKYRQQMILKASGINVPISLLVSEEDWRDREDAVTKEVGTLTTYPLFIKPTREGSSIGVSVIRNKQDFAGGVMEALRWDKRVLVEEFLEGIEFSCIIIEENGEAKPLDLTEIHSQNEFYDYDDKYMPGRCRKFTPP
ncbi:MAG: ATP-grasp domain-containing protein, partial [Smithellaceae bacterium]|nr:ATP-grasp domain-containing protein [Smithellaceae bacterium]